MNRREAGALAVFGGLTVITTGWWALAFWPTGAPTSELLERTRDVCFGTSATGLPDAAGWIALILQPTILFGLYFIIMGQAFEDGVRSVAGRRIGRVLVGGYVVLLFAGLSAVGARLANASDFRSAAGTSASGDVPDTYPEVGRAAPAFSLVDQSGEALSLDRFSGRPVMVTFAFGHCETVCPAVVHDVMAARRRVPGNDAAIVVISLDPWRDLPSRLGHIAGQWELDEDAYAVSGSIAEVEAALDAWRVPRARDSKTGDIVHPRLVYLINGQGTVVYAATGGVDQLAGLLERL